MRARVPRGPRMSHYSDHRLLSWSFSFLRSSVVRQLSESPSSSGVSVNNLSGGGDSRKMRTTSSGKQHFLKGLSYDAVETGVKVTIHSRWLNTCHSVPRPQHVLTYLGLPLLFVIFSKFWSILPRCNQAWSNVTRCDQVWAYVTSSDHMWPGYLMSSLLLAD